MRCLKRCLYFPVSNLSMRIMSLKSLLSFNKKTTTSPTNSPMSHFYPNNYIEFSISSLVCAKRNKICMIRGTYFWSSPPMPANI